MPNNMMAFFKVKQCIYTQNTVALSYRHGVHIQKSALRTILILDDFIEQRLSHASLFTGEVRVVVHALRQRHSSWWITVPSQQ